MNILILILSCWELYPLRIKTLNTWFAETKTYSDVDVKILIGDGPTNDAFVVCPVDDRYGAATYKI